jgi:hypothetical protein
LMQRYRKAALTALATTRTVGSNSCEPYSAAFALR